MPPLLDRLQRQRREFKYLITEDQALAVRDFVGGYLALDEFGRTRPNFSYPVHSLYLDSPDLRLYQDTINGNKNRFKLRVRFYEKSPDAPVFFEIKRRLNDIIRKERGAVKRSAAGLIIAGHLPAPEHLAADLPSHLAALQNFSRLLNTLHAKPRTHVGYQREAWLSEGDNSVRVTMDRAVQSEINPRADFDPVLVNPRLVFGPLVVLELKFTGHYPDWFEDMVRVFGLMRSGAAKYADGVTRLGERLVSRAFAVGHTVEPARRRLERVDARATFQAGPMAENPVERGGHR